MIITSPVTGKSIDASGVKDVMGLLYEDLVKLIADADIELDFSELDRNYGEWGGLLREARVAAAESHAVDPNATAICGPYYFNIDSAYYDEWTEKVFSSEVRRIDVSKVVTGEEEYSDLLNRIVARNVQGYRDEVNQAIEKAMATVDNTDAPALVNITSSGLLVQPYDDTTDPDAPVGSYLFKGGKLRVSVVGGGINGTTGAITNLTRSNYASILSEILYRAKNMTRANAAYTETANRYGASRDDLVIYVSDAFMAGMDIKYIQTLFNTNGLDKLPVIRTFQGITNPETGLDVALILDKRTLNHVTRYFEADVSDITCRKSTMFDLHVEDMIKYVPFYKAWAVVFALPDAATATSAVTLEGGAVYNA